MTLPLVLLNRRRIGGFNPRAIIAGSTAMVWLDPSDLTTMFQDSAGTTPVTAPAQPVGLVLDKSQGLVLGPNVATVSSVTGAAIGGPAFTNYTITPTLTVNMAYEVAFTVSGFSGTGDVGVSATLSRFSPAVPTSISYAGANVSIRFIGINNSASALQLFTRSTNTANFSNISVRELPGFHATQSTAANRPTYGVVPSRGRVNLLTFTEQFDNAGWTKGGATVSANAGTAPDGTVTADKLVEDTSLGAHRVFPNTVPSIQNGVAYVASVHVKAAERTQIRIIENSTTGAFATFDVSNGTVVNSGSGGAGFVTALSNGWYRCEMRFTSAGTLGRIDLALVNSGGISYTGDGTSGILIWGAQLETGSTATTYQRVVSQFEVTDPAGFPSYPLHYLYFGGDLDPRWLQTSTITPNADKVQVFAGVRKLSDAARGVVVEHSASVGSNNGAFLFSAPPGAGLLAYDFISKGTTLAQSLSTGFSAPITNVVTGIGDISGDLATLRVNGTQAAQATTDQGTGNYLAYPLFIGRRGGSSLAFNGNLYGLLVRFSTANLDASVIAQTERWLAQKTGVTI